MTAALATVLVLFVLAAACHSIVHWHGRRGSGYRIRSTNVDRDHGGPPPGPGASVEPVRRYRRI